MGVRFYLIYWCDSHMKRTDLKKMVDEQLKPRLTEDMEKRNAVFNYMKKVLDPDHKWEKKRQDASTPQRGRMTARLLKKIFAKLADRSFVDSLVTIHWGGYGSIERSIGKHVSSRDELSCAAYLPQDVRLGGMGDAGLLVKGHITLLANDMDDLWTGSGERTGVDFPQMKKTSGANKGVNKSFRAVEFYEHPLLVFDKKDWKPARSTAMAATATKPLWTTGKRKPSSFRMLMNLKNPNTKILLKRQTGVDLRF